MRVVTQEHLNVEKLERRNYILTSVTCHSCQVCDEIFDSHNLFTRHMLESHNYTTALNCTLCRKAHNQVMDMNRHLEAKHLPPPAQT